MSTESCLKSYAYTPEKYLPYVSIPDLLQECANQYPDDEAVVFWSTSTPEERSTITYHELYERSKLYSKGLSSFGFQRNSVIAIETANSPEWLVCTYGTLMAGLVPLHFSFGKSSGDDIVSILNNVGKCVAPVVDPCSTDTCNRLIENINCRSYINSFIIPTLRNIFSLTSSTEEYLGNKDIQDLGQSIQDVSFNVSADDIAAIFMTSGSTGMAKAVPYTHRKLIHQGYYWAKYLELESGDNFYSDFPFGWLASYPIIFLTNRVTHVTTNMRALKSIKEIASKALRIMEVEKCVSAILLAPCITELIQRDDILSKAYPLRVVCTAGLPIDSFCAKITERKAKTFAVSYGCTEIGWICGISVSSAGNYENYTVGHPVDGLEVKIVDENGKIVSLNKPGEILVRSRDRFLGYLNVKRKSADKTDERGWYMTDDVGFMNSDKCLVVTGRKSDMMNISGDLVSPSYIEGILKEHHAVANAHVCPLYEENTFQQACAAVILRQDKFVSAEELREHFLKERERYKDSFLATRHIPRTFLFFESFPVTHTGKLNRKLLKEIINERMQNIAHTQVP